jgi:hypothetical protein
VDAHTVGTGSHRGFAATLVCIPFTGDPRCSCVDLTGRGGGMHPLLPVRAHSVYSTYGGSHREGWGDAPTPPCKSTQCTYGGSHREGWLATPCAAQYMDEDFEEWTGTAAPLHLRLAISLLFYTGDCLLASSYLPTLMYGRLPTQGWCPMMSFPRPCHRSTGAPCR